MGANNKHNILIKVPHGSNLCLVGRRICQFCTGPVKHNLENRYDLNLGFRPGRYPATDKSSVSALIL